MIFSDNPEVARVLLLLGTFYEVLQAPELWNIDELYYEACIQKSPYTKTAETCYDKYEQAIFFGYSGSSGLSLPKEVKMHLNELRN